MKNSKFMQMSLASAWLATVLLFFNFAAFEVEQFNARMRVFLVSGKLHAREINEQGIPISRSPRLNKFVSPFYVVHHGLIYSDGLRSSGNHWKVDPSMKYWNFLPEQLSRSKQVEFFKNSADWVMKNVSLHNGNAHLMYSFDWPYEGYPDGRLKAPWWSGLTDSYAIILLLRAADYFGEDAYITMAHALYSSVTAPVESGGSLTRLESCPWVEEYVDPRFADTKMAFVLNGMVYATHGVEAYEKYMRVDERSAFSDAFYECIENNLSKFDMSSWSYYDAIGNAANIKYHRINFILAKDMIARGKVKNDDALVVVESWEKGFRNPGFYYLLNGPRGVAYYHFILSLLLALLLPVLLLVRRRGR